MSGEFVDQSKDLKESLEELKKDNESIEKERKLLVSRNRRQEDFIFQIQAQINDLKTENA